MPQKLSSPGLPITRIEPVTAFAGRLITNLVNVDSDKDGKFETIEILSLFQRIGFDAFQVFQGFNLPEFKAQFRDIDQEERKRLIEIIAKDVDFTNDVIEYLVEDTFRHLEASVSLFERWKKALPKKAK